MTVDWNALSEWAQYPTGFRRLQAYGFGADGSHTPLDWEAISVALDGERGLIMSLAESMPFSRIVMRSSAAS